ncbi:hypothetical protein ACFSO7_02820 [Bacillus sp. CGMCC 1.16607]|uniref:hypothetical protein n=1 Tax=Bacillus sp. CGMCC 1.16607 TaxID=3351842 RepID=UPI00362EC0AC
MFKKIKRFKDLLFWKFSILKQKIKHPNEGKYTLMCLAAGYTLEDIDHYLANEYKGDYTDDDIHVNRNDWCSEEVSCWEE